MLEEITSPFYQYLRGGIFTLYLFNLIIYVANKKREYLFYSGYFFCILLFFFGQEWTIKNPGRWFSVVTPSIHCGTFVFYISFAREILNTTKTLPSWDPVMVKGRMITGIMIPVFILIYILFGIKIQGVLFIFLAIATTIFTVLCYVQFLKINTQISRLFLLGSFGYTFLAVLSLFAGFSFGGYSGFITKVGVHPSMFMYVGSFVEAFLFSFLLGNKIEILEKEKKDSIKAINHLKKTVIKNHIVLKDKTKVYVSQLVFVKSEDHYLRLYLENGKTHLVRGKIKEILKELPPNFIQSHRSYLVNSNFIKQNTSNTLFLISGQNVPISKRYQNQV